MQKIKGGDDLADKQFKIMLTTDIKDGGADKKLADLKNKYEKDGIQIKTGLNLAEFKTQMTEIQNSMKNAFKMDKTQLSNLEALKSVLKEVNQLSKQASAKIFGNNGASKEKQEIDGLVKKYDQLISKQKSIEQQMSKTSNTQSYTALARELTKVRTEAESVGKAIDKMNTTKGNSNITRSLANTFQNVQKQIDATQNKINNLLKNKNLSSKQMAELTQLSQQLKELQNIKLDNIINAEKPYEEMSKLVKGTQEVKAAFDGLKINITFDDQIEKSKTSIDGLISKLQTLSKSGFSDKSGIANTISQLERLKAELGTIDPNSSNATAQFKEIANSINECENEYKQFNSAMQSSKANFKFETNLNKTLSDLQQLRQRCVELGQSTTQVDALEQQLKELGNVSTDKAIAGLQRIRSEMSTFKSSMKSVNTATVGVSKTFSNLYSTMSTFSLGNILAMQIQKGIYSIGSTITELDSAFRDLMKVAPDNFVGTTKQLDDIRKKAISVGQDVARSSVDVINSTASALQLGLKDMDKALEYAKNTNAYANVSDQSTENADSQLKGILSAFGGIDSALENNQRIVQGASSTYNEMTAIMDAMNFAGNNYAVTAGDMGVALSKFASVANSSGISAYEAISYAMGTNETLQNAAKTGNALKTILTNLNGLKTSAKDGSVKLNKTALVLKNIAGIDVLDATGQVKDMNEILGELGSKYNDLSKNDKLALGEAIGGKTQINAVQALLSNWEQVVKFQDEYNSGSMIGSADKENKRFVDSIEGRIIKLQEELKELVTTTISTDMFKGLVSGLTSVFSAINDVVGAFDKLGLSTPLVIGSISSLFMTIKSLGTGTNLTNIGGNLLSGFLNIAKGSDNTSRSITSLGNTLRDTNRQLTILPSSASGTATSVRLLSDNTRTATRNISTLSRGTSTLRASCQSYSSSVVSSTLKTSLATVGVSLLNGALLSLAGIGITLATKALYNWVNANKIAHDKIVESISITKDKINSLKTEKSSLKDLSSEYDKLTEKTKLTNDESKKLAELKGQIAEISPSLVVGYDANNDPILALSGSLEDYIEGLDEAIKRQNDLLKTQQNSAADKSRGTSNQYLSASLDKAFSNSLSVSDAYNDFTNMFNSDGIKAFRDGANQYVKILESRNEKISALNIQNAENFEKYSEIELEQQQKVINKLSDDETYKNFNSLNDKTRSAMSALIGSFDWESSVANTLQGQNKFIEGFDSLSEKIGKNSDKVKSWNNAIISANDAYQKTGDIEAYKKSISDVTEELEKMTGISQEDWTIGLTQQLSGGLDEAKIGLNDFLKSYNKTYEDLQNGDPIALKFKAEYDNTQNLLQDLTVEGQTFESAVDLLVKVNEGKIDYGNLPYQMQTFLSGALDGGSKMSTDELQAFMKISTIISSQGELDNNTFALVTKMLNGELSQEEIELGISLPDGTTLNKNIIESINNVNKEKGNKNVKVGIESDLSKFKDDLKTILGKDKDTRLKINTEVESKDLDGLSETLKNIDEEKQIDILTSIIENGQLTTSELEKVLDTLPPEVQTVIRTILEEEGLTETNARLQNLPAYVNIVINTELNEQGKIELDKMAEWLNSTDLSKSVQLDIVSDVSNNDLDALLEHVQDLDPEIQLQVLSNAGSVLSTFGDLDNYKFSQKLIELSVESGDIDSAISMIETLDDNQKVRVITELIENGDITSDNLEEFLNTLPEKKQTEVELVLTNKEELESLKSELEGLDLDKEILVKINKALAENDIDTLLSVISTLPLETQVEVLALIQDALSNLNTVDQKKIEDKIATIKADDQASSVIAKVPTQDETKTIWVKAQKVVSDAWNWLTGGGSGGSSGGGGTNSSIGEFSNISDTPIEASNVSAQSSTFSSVSPTPTETSSGVASAKASYAPIDFVSTSKTQATKISTSYKNVWNVIKYGIDLFTELENRIKRTQNNLDLLSSKMENAVGTNKIKYLKQQNELYKEQAKLQNTLYKSLVNEKSSVSKKIKNQGFKVNSQGNISNYEEQMLKLEKAAEAAEKKASSYSGKNEKTKKSLEKNADNAKTALDNAKKATEEYLKLQYTEIPNAKKEWQDLQNAIKETNDEIEQLNFENKIYKEQHAIDELSVALERASTLADRYATMADRYDGAKKIKYLKLESDKIKEQIELNEKLEKQLSSQRYDYRGQLSKYGVKFDSNKNISNYDDVLNKYQNSQDYDKIKSWMEEYVDLTEAQRDAVNNTEDLKNAQIDLDNEIKKAELDSKISSFSIKISQASQNVKKLTNEIDLLSVKMQHAVGKDKLDLINQQIEKWEQLAKEQQNALDSMKSQEKTYQSELSKYNFNFDDSGNITNKDAMIAKYKDDDSYEYILDTIEKWEQLYNEDIPNATQSIEEYRNSVKDAYQSQLDITKEIEDKITSLYKKQIEDRKNAIQKETDAIVKNLNDQKKAYMDMRKEIDYKNDYTEKTDNISDLERQLEIAKKDTSLSNKKKIADLEKQLADAQKDLDKFVQDKIDSDIENSYDNAIDSAEEKGNAMIEALEELWSDSKIAEMISESLKTGLFTGIDGEVSNLQDALLGYAEDAGEVFGVTGAIIKNELVGNLDIALSTMKDLANIMNGLEVPNFDTSSSLGNISSNNITTGNISVNVTAETNSNPEDIANEVRKAIEEALKGTVQGI